MEHIDFVIGTGMDGIRKASDAAVWLEETMPNPPTDSPQRWDLFTLDDDTVSIRFYDEKDSVLFALKWL
jgi:hypothetical protein